MTTDYEKAGAAKAWGQDWDTWQTLSIEAQGVMLARFRAENRIAAWEAHLHKRKMKSMRQK